MALTSTAGRPKEGAVTQPPLGVTHDAARSLPPAGRISLQNVGDIEVVKGKLQTSYLADESMGVCGFTETRHLRLESLVPPIHLGPRFKQIHPTPLVRRNAGPVTQGNPAGGAAAAAPGGTHGSTPPGRHKLRNEDRGDSVKREQGSLNLMESEGDGLNPSSPLLEGGERRKDAKDDTPDHPPSPMRLEAPTHRRRSNSSERGILSAFSDSNSESPSEDSSPPRAFCVYGIDAYPSLALKKEICIDFIDRQRWCPFSSRCYRIHPKERKFYLALLREGKSQELFHHDRTPTTMNHFGRQDDIGSSPSLSRERISHSHLMEGPLPPPLDKIPQPPYPKRDYNWDSASGHWSFKLNQEAWHSEDSSSSEGSVDIFTDQRVSQPSRNSSDTEEDMQCPSPNSQPPPLQEACRDFLKGCCTRGTVCRFHHAVVEKDARVPPQPQASLPPPPAPVLPPRFRNGGQGVSPIPPGACNLWLQGRCWRGKTCHYLHPEIKTERQVPSPSVLTTSASSIQRHQRPPFDETCRDWLRGVCQKGPLCTRVHDDLEYDETKPRRNLIQVPARTIPEVFSTVIYKHIKIQVTEGFEVVDTVTGFETSWIYIGNVPRRVQHERLAALLKDYGELIDLRIPDSPAPLVVAKARFVDAATASKVCSAVDGLEAFGSTLTAKLSISVNSDARIRLNDTSVRVRWEAPSKTAYVGFKSKECYANAMGKCRSTPLGKHLLRAAAHTGIPAVGRFSLRVDAVPADVDVEGLKEFLGADAVMWGQTNYTSWVKALNGIQRMVAESGADLMDFNVVPPPFKGGIVVAWAQLATSAEAKKLCDYMHTRKPNFTGNTRIFAQHVQSLEYTLPKDVYERVRRDIDALAASAWRMGHFTVVSKVLPATVLVRLGAEDTQGLSKLKAELDIILSGEIVREDGKVVWDRFFPQLAGQVFIAGLQRQHAPITIQVDKVRKHIRLFGASAGRLAVRTRIMEKVEVLRKQSVHLISLDGRMLGVFMNEGLSRLSEEIGDDCVQLDLWNRSLVVRGDQHAHNAVRDSVNRTRRSLNPIRHPALVECPVCFDEVSTPITLCCGHSWCKTCIIRYMMTAVDQKVFPLTCLGDDAKCEEKIPLSCAKQLLPPPDFEALIEASFSTYIHRRPDEFSYCPTPDCQQIYRHLPLVDAPQQPPKIQKSNSSPSQTPSVAVGTVLQCPSCLVRICASCQTEAHDGLACTRPGENDSLFEEWMKNNDVKPCPGCKMPIEKAMGCHHVTCTVCSTHVCWLCLTPFHNGAGVYSHMLAVHGSFV